MDELAKEPSANPMTMHRVKKSIACFITLALIWTSLPWTSYAQHLADTQSHPSTTLGAPAHSLVPAALPAFSIPTDFIAAFPKLQFSSNLLEDIGTLKRILARTGLDPHELGAMSAAARSDCIESAIKDYAETLVAEAEAITERQAKNPVQFITESSSLKHRVEDTLAAVKIMELKPDSAVDGVLNRSLLNINSALIAQSDALIETIQSLLPNGAAWHGRTAVVPLGTDGSAVAFKYAKPDKGVEGEGEGLERAGRFGIEAPVALPSRDGYIRQIAAQTPQAGYGSAFMAYLLPGKLTGEFFSYLGDALPEDWSREQKSQAIRSSALKAVDGLVRLFENGWVHGTLAPLSHSAAAWRWDYWRANEFRGLPRFGPSSLHNWDEGLSHANVRLSGLADFEHLKRLEIQALGEKAARSQARKEMGQNFFDLSMLIWRAGYRNKLNARQIAEILADVLNWYAVGISGDRRFEIKRSVLLPLLTGIVRRFYIFHALADAMPRFLVRWHNDAVSRASYSNSGIPQGAALVMQGEIVHPLIMDVINPYVENLTGDLNSPNFTVPEQPYRLAQIDLKANKSRLKKAVSFATTGIMSLLLGFETAAYLGGLGSLREPWIWQRGADKDAQLRREKAAMLRGHHDKDSLALIAKALDDQDVGVRINAAVALQGRQDAGSLKLIAKALGDQDVGVRTHAGLALQGRQDADSMGLIAKTLDDQNREVRMAAAEALRGRQHEAGSLGLIARALDDQDVEIRRNVAQLLFNQKGTGFLELIAKALDDQDTEIRMIAVDALPGHHGELSLKLIAKALSDPDVGVRINAALVRSQYGSLELIAEGLGNQNVEIRKKAVLLLYGHQDAGSLELIAKALGDQDLEVRATAAATFQGRRDIGSLELIAKVLNDPERKVRLYAPFALRGRQQEAGSLELIVKALDDQASEVRREAVKVLKERLGIVGSFFMRIRIWIRNHPNEIIRRVLRPEVTYPVSKR